MRLPLGMGGVELHGTSYYTLAQGVASRCWRYQSIDHIALRCRRRNGCRRTEARLCALVHRHGLTTLRSLVEQREQLGVGSTCTGGRAQDACTTHPVGMLHSNLSVPRLTIHRSATHEMALSCSRRFCARSHVGAPTMFSQSLNTMAQSPRSRVRRLASGCITERAIGAWAVARARRITRQRSRNAVVRRMGD